MSLEIDVSVSNVRQMLNYFSANFFHYFYCREEEGPNIRVSFEDQMLQFVRNYANPPLYAAKTEVTKYRKIGNIFYLLQTTRPMTDFV